MPKTKTSKRHQGVTLESMDSKLDLVVEMVSKNTEDITDLKTVKNKVEAIQEDVEIIKIGIEFIKSDLKRKVGIDEFTALERRVSILENRSR